MKTAYRTLGMAAMGICLSVSANAANRSVEDRLRDDRDLSSFYEALINTGVIDELSPNMRYTILAPTNEAWAELTPAEYPCLYSAQCKAEIADLLRNHIVPGEEHVSDVVGRKGGLYSVDSRFIPVGEPRKNDFSADGHQILSQSMFGAGILYKLDGVIANPQELALVRDPVMIPTTAVVEERTTTTTTTGQPVTEVYCAGPNCPQAVSQTTTVTRTITNLPPAAR